MLMRCENQKSPSFKDYGGRGIRVCNRWQEFKYFAEDVGLKPFQGATLDRIDNNGDYEPCNVKWSTRTEQCVNRRTFKNNTSGATGVIRSRSGCFSARFDYAGKRYQIGLFTTYEEAVTKRMEFLSEFFKDRERAIRLLPTDRKVRSDSSTGLPGVTKNLDGKYIVRCTVNGKRVYVGYFDSLIEAEDARQRFLETGTTFPKR
jgi:hypothetical protein